MLMPRKVKFRKRFRGKNRGMASRGNALAFGLFGLQSLENKELTARQIEAGRRTITHACKRQGKYWIRQFPHFPITKKPAEVRMGGGKGSVEYWATKVKRGHILFEIDGVSSEVATRALQLAADKMPMRTRIITEG
jgi:large subunit ribosomal protein L16